MTQFPALPLIATNPGDATNTGHSVQLFDHLVVIALYYFTLWSGKLNK